MVGGAGQLVRTWAWEEGSWGEARRQGQGRKGSGSAWSQSGCGVWMRKAGQGGKGREGGRRRGRDSFGLGVRQAELACPPSGCFMPLPASLQKSGISRVGPSLLSL